MPNSRRQFIQQSAALTVGAMLPVFAEDDIVVGSVLNLSGGYKYYGNPMERAGNLAIAEINAGGGVLGREVQHVIFDGHSVVNLYELYGRELLYINAQAAHGGFLPEERRALFAALQENVPYFCSAPAAAMPCGEGVVNSGITPAQQLSMLLPYAAAQFGKKVAILASDSPYGRQTAETAAELLRENGGELLQTEFVPFADGDFSAAIGRIRDATPDVLLSVLIGKKHLFFYKQWKDSGLKAKIPLISTTFGAANEQQLIPPEDGDGILVAFNYAKAAALSENEKFIAAWNAAYDSDEDIHEIAVSYYQGLLLWAKAAQAADGLAREALMQVVGRGDVVIDAPSGRVALDGQTNRAVLDVHLMRVENQQMYIEKTITGQHPTEVQQTCAQAG